MEGVSGGCFAVFWGEYSAAAQVCEKADSVSPVSCVSDVNLSDLKFKEKQRGLTNTQACAAIIDICLIL